MNLLSTIFFIIETTIYSLSIEIHKIEEFWILGDGECLGPKTITIEYAVPGTEQIINVTVRQQALTRGEYRYSGFSVSLALHDICFMSELRATGFIEMDGKKCSYKYSQP